MAFRKPVLFSCRRNHKLTHANAEVTARSVLTSSSYGRMERFIDTAPLDSGPVYFFDQLKPKMRKWKKERQEDNFLYPKADDDLEDLAQDLTYYRPEKFQENPVALSVEEDKPQTVVISEPTSMSKLPSDGKFTKMYLYKSLFQEYKLIASEILYELEKTLEKYAKHHMAFPVGIINLLTYSWQDLIEDSYKSAPKKKMLVRNQTLQEDSSSISIKKHKSSLDSKEQLHGENHLAKVRKIPPTVPSKSLSFPSHTQSSQESNVPTVIHFSLSSKICLENGWIFPYSNLEILKWMTDLSTAVKKLQGAMIQMKTEEAKLKKEGFNKQLILRHYNDPEEEEETIDSLHDSQTFWMDLLGKKPQMPTVREPNPEMKKFHYALIDGSSLTYYPSGRLAVCQSYSDLPWGGLYTNIFSDLPDAVILGTFTPFGCGSISFPQRNIITMMFNQDGGIVISKNGDIIKEWIWPSKGKLKKTIKIWVNKYITVNISGRFAITLVYKWQPQILRLSLAPVKHKILTPCLPDKLFPDISPISGEARELFKMYKRKCKLLESMAQNKNPSSLADPVDTDIVFPAMDISLMHDLVTSIKLKSLQRKVKHILLHWLNYYRSMLGLESLHICKIPIFTKMLDKTPKVSLEVTALEKNAKEEDNHKECLRYRNTFLALKEFFKPSPHHCAHRTSTANQSFRLPVLIKRKDVLFPSQLVCPVVLRRTLYEKEEDICRCSSHSIPEVTDLEYDHLISKQLCHMDQIIVVCVFSTKEEDETIEEVTNIYKELNRSRSMPCIQSRLDPFRLLKYDIMSASKFTGSNCPLLVQRHNIVPGIFLVCALRSMTLSWLLGMILA